MKQRAPPGIICCNLMEIRDLYISYGGLIIFAASGYLQVETVAQFGVIFLLFGLGLEFSMAKVLIERLLHV